MKEWTDSSEEDVWNAREHSDISLPEAVSSLRRSLTDLPRLCSVIPDEAEAARPAELVSVAAVQLGE